MEPNVTFSLDAFELTLTDIASVDLEALHALSIGVGWPHRASDWQMLRDLGQGLAAVDEIGRVVGSVMWMHYGSDAAMVGMMITSPRLQELGAGRWLMSEAMRRNEGRRLALTATRVARRLYRSLDFIYERPIHQCQGEALAPPDMPMPDGATIRPIGPADHADVLSLDRTATGMDRATMLTRLLAEAEGTLLIRDGRPEAFALCRRFGRGHVIGPVAAATDADAIAVAAPHAAAHVGDFLRCDTPEAEGDFFAFLMRCGLADHDIVTSMGIGREPYLGSRPDGPRRYALASQALG
ncbi:GNAT family N-acetyltransferase [Prosthecodimorpha staleyi]|uniref:GNAT family N-acetyltransferase n=1 Tax=Prosthecodimorpha staleyi TaxID=2840188 RepID=UPI0021C41492|nr:GNAT family N-acetyltransferase [Prosthecodimorpha staleyi]